MMMTMTTTMMMISTIFKKDRKDVLLFFVSQSVTADLGTRGGENRNFKKDTI